MERKDGILCGLPYLCKINTIAVEDIRNTDKRDGAREPETAREKKTKKLRAPKERKTKTGAKLGMPLKDTLLKAWRSFAAWFIHTFAFVGRGWKRLAAWWSPYGTKLRKYISPVFITMLVVSFALWYMIKLGYTYTAEMPVNVNIEGREVRATVVFEATGYRLMSYRFSSRKNISVQWSDLEVTPSSSNPQAVVVSPFALQNIVSVRNPDIKVVSMGNIPEIEL